MATTGNNFGSLEDLGGLDHSASRREILGQLERAKKEKKGSEENAAVLPETPLATVGRFSESESAGLREEGWRMVSHRTKARKQSLTQTPDEESLVAGTVVPRSVPAGVPVSQALDAPDATEAASWGRSWRVLGWSSLAVVGVLTLAKVCSRR